MSRGSWLVAVLTVSAALAASASPAGAATCTPTPTDSFGPFGRGLPPQRAKIGTGHILTGVVLSALDCRPIAGATVELWQSGKQGRYTRAGSATVKTNRAGRFRFEGPFPPAYEGAPPHIHLRVTGRGHEQLLTRFVAVEGQRRGTVRLVLRPEAV